MSVEEIGYIDEASMWLHIPATVPLRLVEERLRGRGLSLGPQPPSVFRGSVRDWLEGPHAGRWVEGGRLASAVAAVTVALDDGGILRTHPTPRSATGPSVAQIFLGSEGRSGELLWVVLRSRPLSRRTEEVAFEGEKTHVSRWLEVESQRIAPPLGAEIVGGDRPVVSVLFPADGALERARIEAALATARALGLLRREPPGVQAAERPWEREVPSEAWHDLLDSLPSGARVWLTRIARESAVAVTTEEVGNTLPSFVEEDPSLRALGERLVAILRPH